MSLGVEEQMFEVMVEEWNQDIMDCDSLTTPRGVQCRICMRTGDSEDLLSPCRCVGSVQYIHEGCLKAWILAKGNLTTAECELCQTLFRSEYRTGRTCQLRNLSDLSKPQVLAFWFGLFLALVSFCLLIPIILYIANGAHTTVQTVALIAVLVVICLMECALLGITVCLFVAVGLPVNVKSWKIYNRVALKEDIERTIIEVNNSRQACTSYPQRNPRID